MITNVDEGKLDRPAYPAAEAARLVGLTPDRVRRWLRGYSYSYDEKRVRQNPLIRRSDDVDSSYASFLDLIDLLFAKQFLAYGISLQKLRKALDEVTAVLGTKHFARETFFTDGSKVFVEFKDKGEYMLELLSGGQWVIPDVIRQLSYQIQFDARLGLARCWYPLGPESHVVIDPLHSFGRPSLNGRSLTTANVYDFYLAEGRRVRTTCRWWGLTQEEVNSAVRFEEKLAA